MGLPSASSMEALELCPGRHLACQGIEDTRTKDATFGDRVHFVLCEMANGNAAHRDIDESVNSAAIDLWKKGNDLVEWWKQANEITDCSELIERRLLLSSRDGVPLMTGQGDRIVISRDHALIIDYKSLPGDVSDSKDNGQLRSLVALVGHSYDAVFTITGAIIQRMTGKPEPVVYRGEEIDAAIDWSERVAIAAMDPNAPRNPGEKQCKWCRFKPNCPEANAKAVAVVERLGPVDLVTHKIASLAPDRLAQLFDQVTFAQTILKTAREEIEKRVDAESIPGLERGEGSKTSEVSDMGALFSRLRDKYGIDDARFVRGATISKKEIKAMIKEWNQEMSGAALDKACATLLVGIVTEKLKRGSVGRVNAEVRDGGGRA